MEREESPRPEEVNEGYSFTESDITNNELHMYADTEAIISGNDKDILRLRKYAIEGDPPEATKGKLILSREAFIQEFGIKKKINNIIASHNPEFHPHQIEQEQNGQPLSEKTTDVAKAYDLAKQRERNDIIHLLKTGALVIVNKLEEDNGLDHLTFENYVKKFGLDQEIVEG